GHPKVPANMRQLIFAQATACRKINGNDPTGDCSLGPSAIAYFSKSHVKGWKSVLAIYDRLLPVCQGFRPAASGKIDAVSISWDTDSTTFVCGWGQLEKRSKIGVTITVVLPNTGHKLKLLSCKADEFGHLCVQFPNGVYVHDPYSLDTWDAGVYRVQTPDCSLNITRYTSNEAAYKLHEGDDLSVFNWLSAGLGLPRNAD
ncbi:MAG TPA: hypothetical protein VG964_00695, partial [Candidatus Saccharimonadales bacterium]|nr:hypothetical protein [Candidatus Saccharimonadales bacterium]